MNNDCYAIYTSPPPAAEPLLKEKLLKGSAEMKKIAIGILIVLAPVVVLCVPYWVDDFSCNNYKKDIENTIKNVGEIQVLDMLNGCGNVANGNHTHLIVTALVETELTKDSIKNKFPDAYNVVSFEELHFETKTKKQFSKYVTGDTKNYYVLAYVKSAPFYYIDLRGH